MTRYLRPRKSEPHATGQSGGVLGQNTCGIAARLIVAHSECVSNGGFSRAERNCIHRLGTLGISVAQDGELVDVRRRDGRHVAKDGSTRVTVDLVADRLLTPHMIAKRRKATRPQGELDSEVA